MTLPTSHTSHTSPVQVSPPTLLQRVVWLTFFYTFGLFNWCLYLCLALRSGAFFQKDTEQDQLRFAISRDRFWNLSKQPVPGFEHAFFNLRGGKKLHYITNRSKSWARSEHRNNGNLFVFLHGFPDSSVMWRHCLKDPAIPISSARLICLDLPNYGGSDTFENPDTVVLEAVTEFVLAMREEHETAASNNSRSFSTIIVAHDWGCVIGFRLAAEAPQLADRFILSNGPHIGLSLSNKDRVIHSSSKIFKLFKEAPSRNFGCLAKSFHALRPLLFQLLMFGYIFAFHLPSFMVKYLGTGGNMAFLKGALRSAYGKHKDEWNAQESLASTLGPGVIEVETKTQDGESYGVSVHERASSHGTVFWHQTAYYRNGLATKPWEKSLEAIAELYNLERESSASASVSPLRRRSSSSASSALFTDQYDGALRAPATILWGEKDRAIGKTICLDGIGDYLARGSEVILLPQTGHWAPVEKESRAAIAHVISVCAAAGDNLPVYMTKDVDEVYAGSLSLVRR